MVTNRLSHLCRVRRPPPVALFSGNYNHTVDGPNKSLNRLVGHLEQSAGVQVRVYSRTASSAESAAYRCSEILDAVVEVYAEALSARTAQPVRGGAAPVPDAPGLEPRPLASWVS
jgi:hypothetical protein